MARRAALSTLLRALQIAVASLGLLLSSCGGSNTWSCTWRCNSTGASGSHSYPDGPDPTPQCEMDYGTGCNDFSCGCHQG
jgi:hypothetical protein